MPRIKEDLEKATIRLVRGDTKILEQFYPTVGYNAVIRKLVHKHCRALQERASRAEAETAVEINLELN